MDMNKQEKEFLSDLSLTFDLLDERRWLCFYLAIGMSIAEAKTATNTWIAECSKNGIEVLHGFSAKH